MLRQVVVILNQGIGSLNIIPCNVVRPNLYQPFGPSQLDSANKASHGQRALTMCDMVQALRVLDTHFYYAIS